LKVLIGTPVHRQGAYALEKYLANQKQIQQNHADCELLLSTDNTGYQYELMDMLEQWHLRGTVIPYMVEKPPFARSRLWNIASGREAIRRYFLQRTAAERLLFLDADMTYDPQIISIMEKEIINHDAVFSGYRFRNNRIGLIGAGCFLLRREALQNISFRCYEFKNGQTINEDNMAEMDLFRHGYRIKKGFFLDIDHYYSSTGAKHITPHKVGLWKKMLTGSFIRFCLIRTSLAIHYNIPTQGQKALWFFLSLFEKLHRA